MPSRRHISEIEKNREALSLRGVEREYGFARQFTAKRVRAGDIPATPRGRALVILRADFEKWMRDHAIRPTSHAERRVAELLDRERKPSAA